MTQSLISMPEAYMAVAGELEFEFRDCNGITLATRREPNLVKIAAKEIISHRVPHSKIWDPSENDGAGGWISHGVDLDEYSAKYIVFGASYDADGNPLDTADSRYYTYDSVTGGYVRNAIGVGAENDGGLINAIPIAEPYRPLKRVERIYWESSYQPAGSPLLQADTRALNNIMVLETTLRKDEYNGFGTSGSGAFTITEVALIGAKELSTPLGACECDPRDIFLTGQDGIALAASASGGSTVSLDEVSDLIKEGDQIKLVAIDSTAPADAILDQVNPYYLVTSKALGGRDLTLDRTPVDSAGDPITGEIGILRDGFRIFSQRVLRSPFRKSSEIEVVVRWRIVAD